MAQVCNAIKKVKANLSAMSVLTLLIVGGAVTVQAANLAPSVRSIDHQGEENRAKTCSACHGANGMGQSATGIPRLAGLNAAYLVQQLDDFVGGTRQSSVMAPIAKALNQGQRETLAAYYSELPVSVSKSGHLSKSPPDDNLGERLAKRGIWSKQVPGCVQCHGPHGIGVGTNFPPLAGQSALYIANQLHAWQNGTRRNDPLGLMRHVASALNEKDIRAVAEWFAAQPVIPPEGRR